MNENALARANDLNNLIEFRDATVLFAIGLNFEFGFGDDVDLDMAKAYFELAAQQGNIAAKYRLYMVETQRQQALGKYSNKSTHLLTEIAEQGYAPAMHLLAVAYWYGLGIVKDRARAENWLKKSATAKYPAAMFDEIFGIGWNGVGSEEIVNSDEEKMNRLKTLVETGHPMAMSIFGSLLIKSEDEKTQKAGLDYIERSAQAGCSVAHYSLATIYEDGLARVEINREKAAHHFSMSEKFGDRSLDLKQLKLKHL